MSLTKVLLIGWVTATAAALAFHPGSLAGPIDPTTTESQPEAMRPDVAAYRRGLRALDQGNLDEAEQAFEASFRANDQVVQPLLGLVEVAHRKGDLDRAEVHLLLAEQTAPDSADVHFAKARFYTAQARRLDAKASLERAAELAPDRADILVELGVLLTRDLGRHGEAVEVFDAALAKDDRLGRAHLGRGSALLALGDPAEARLALETAAQIEPDNASVWDRLARVALAEDDFQGALDYYERSIAVDANRAAPYVGRGDIFASLGDLDAAVAAFEAGAAADPAHSGAVLTRLGMAKERLGDTTAAVAAYERAIALDDRQAAAFNNLAAILSSRRERLGEALVWSRRAVELRPDIPHFEDTLGWLLYISGNAEAGLVHVEAAAEQLPDHPEVQYHLGVLREANGDLDGAQAALETALRLSDSFPEANNARERLARLR